MPAPTKFVNSYENSVTYQEPDGENGFKTVTNTRRKVRCPGVEGCAPGDASHWQIQLESTVKKVFTIPSSATTRIPDWVAEVLTSPLSAAREPPATSFPASRVAEVSTAPVLKTFGPRAPTPGPSKNATHSAGRRLRQQAIGPYFRGLRMNSRAMLSPGRHSSNPIVIVDNSPQQGNRMTTRQDTRSSAVTFQAGAIRLALPPNVDPTLITIVQHPFPQEQPDLQQTVAKKRKVSEMTAAEEAELEADVFSNGRPAERNPVASSSTCRQAIPTCSGRKRLCISAPSSIAAPLSSPLDLPPSSPAPSSSPSNASSPSPSDGSSRSSASKGKRRLN